MSSFFFFKLRTLNPIFSAHSSKKFEKFRTHQKDNFQKFSKHTLLFGSDRSSRNADLSQFVHSFVSNLSRDVNLHLSRSESNRSTQEAVREHSESDQKALREHSESDQRAIRVLISESYSWSLKVLPLVFLTKDKSPNCVSFLEQPVKFSTLTIYQFLVIIKSMVD